MNILSLFNIAWSAMRANKARTSLTVLGMIIGIASVIVVFSAGEGLSNLVSGQLEMFGTDIIEVEIKVPSSKTGGASETQSAANIISGVQITTLTLDDMEDIDKLPNVKDSYGGIIGQELVSYGGELQKSLIWGVSSSFINIDNTNLNNGRFFTESEDKSLASVVVLGSKTKEKLFGDGDAIGRSVRIRESKFRVIGVMEERGSTFGMDFDELIYMPIMSLQKRVMGIDHLQFTIHQLYDISIADQTAEDARVILRENHNISPPKDVRTGWTDTGKDDFRVVTMEEMMKIMGVITGALTYLLLGIVAISLIVGGVGILNIMYVIVSERTSEIGLRKAVGAKYSDIMRQFLVESILITLVGGIIGILFGIFISYLISLVANSYGLDWGFIVPIKAFVTAIIFSIVFGVIFGVYPARKAARMDPVKALFRE